MNESSRKKVRTMVSTLIKAGIVAAIVAVVIYSLPDIKRYMQIREM